MVSGHGMRGGFRIAGIRRDNPRLERRARTLSDLRVVEVAELDLAFEPWRWPFAEIHAARIAAHWAQLRKEKPEVGWGDFKIIGARDPAILIIRYDSRNNSVLFVHNLDERPREISFRSGIAGGAGELLVNLLSEDHSRANVGSRHKLLLEGYGYRWYRWTGLSVEAQRYR